MYTALVLTRLSRCVEWFSAILWNFQQEVPVKCLYFFAAELFSHPMTYVVVDHPKVQTENKKAGSIRLHLSFYACSIFAISSFLICITTGIMRLAFAGSAIHSPILEGII